LWVCENGVLDLEIGLFRDGRPDDYMSLSCNLNYHKYGKDDDEYKELKEYFRKVFVNKARRSYFKDTACAAMEGGNINKIFIVGTGGGDNAKSVTYELLEKVFGEYCIKFPRELLIVSRTNSSSGARPELARVRGRRLALAQEIAKTETLNIGVLKELTGNDSFFARGIYEKGTEVRPCFTLFMQCNEPPGVPGHDEATWNRIRVLDYESKFVKPQDLEKYPVPEDEKEQYKMKRFKADLSFGKRLPELAPVLLSMLFDRRKKYKQRGLKEPKEVKLSTNMYRANNDVYLQFIQDRIEEITYPKKTPLEKMTFLRLPDLYSEFTSWYQENYSSYREKFNKVSLMHEFNKKFSNSGKQGRIHGWYGYKICDEEITDEKQRKLQEILGGKNSNTTLEKENKEDFPKTQTIKDKSVPTKTSKNAKLKKKSSTKS
jgi:phage/plasmid-associated DNA primase